MGCDLLQHAVSWGMCQLAGRIFAGLLAPPLSMPFSAVAHSNAPTGDGAPPCSLLTCALLSESEAMLACVLEWGAAHGGTGFEWGQHEGGSEDQGLLQVVQSLPPLSPPTSTEPMLRALLSDPTAAPATQRALTAEVAEAAQPQEGVDNLAAPAVGVGVDAAAAGLGVAVMGQAGAMPVPAAAATDVSVPAQTPLPAILRPGPGLKLVRQALVGGFGEHGEVKESGYRWGCCMGLGRSMAHCAAGLREALMAKCMKALRLKAPCTTPPLMSPACLI